MRAPWLIAITIWVIVLAVVIYKPPSPVEYTGGDTVHPTTVRAGEIITITRNYRVTRDHPAVISRVMIRGDCKVRCDRIDLPATALEFVEGNYMGNRRSFTIPATATPGTWDLVFTVHWRDRLGREWATHVPKLRIEVVQ